MPAMRTTVHGRPAIRIAPTITARRWASPRVAAVEATRARHSMGSAYMTSQNTPIDSWPSTSGTNAAATITPAMAQRSRWLARLNTSHQIAMASVPPRLLKPLTISSSSGPGTTADAASRAAQTAATMTMPGHSLSGGAADTLFLVVVIGLVRGEMNGG